MFNRKSPEEITRLEVEKRKLKEENEERKRAERFAKTPAGQARAAKMAGAQIFQFAAPLSKTSANVVAMKWVHLLQQKTLSMHLYSIQ